VKRGETNNLSSSLYFDLSPLPDSGS